VPDLSVASVYILFTASTAYYYFLSYWCQQVSKSNVPMHVDNGFKRKLCVTDCGQTAADSDIVTIDKCTKHQFIHLLTAKFKHLHIENSKNYKKVILPASH